MQERKWIAIAVGAVGVVGCAAMLWPTLLPTPSAERTSPPDFGSEIVVTDARIALPATASEAAEVYFTISNRETSDSVFVTGVAVEGAGPGTLADASGPVTTQASNIEVSPGQTVTLSHETWHGIFPEYGPDVVPGAKLNLRISFANSGSVVVPAEVTIRRTAIDTQRILPGTNES